MIRRLGGTDDNGKVAHDFMFNSNVILSRLVFRNIGDTYLKYPRPPLIFCAAEALCFRYVRPSLRAFFRILRPACRRLLFYPRVRFRDDGHTITLTGVFDFFAAFSAIAGLLAVFCYR